jgi:hypothetical protein
MSRATATVATATVATANPVMSKAEGIAADPVTRTASLRSGSASTRPHRCEIKASVRSVPTDQVLLIPRRLINVD